MSASFSLLLSCVCAGCGYAFDTVERARGGHRLSTTEAEDGQREHLVEVSKACPRCLSYRVRVSVGFA